MEAAPRSERVSLSRDLSEFLIELSIALHRHSMYPIGHPALVPAIESVTRRAEKLLEDRPSIAFGVARRQLIIDGITTDPDQPVLRRLADGLHRHHIGAVSIMRGMQVHELGEALHALAVEADKDGPVGLKPDVASWPHVKLHPLTFDGLALAGDTPSGGGAQDSDKASDAVDLWIGLARAALASDGSEGGEPLSSEPSDVARAINENSGRAEAYDAGPADTALREAQEEIGLERRHAEIIGTLPVYHTGTNYSVTPVVALLRPPFELRADPGEVAEIFEVPLAFLMDGLNHQRLSAERASGRRSFYAMPYQGYYIWGATAGMLRNLFHFLRAE